MGEQSVGRDEPVAERMDEVVDELGDEIEALRARARDLEAHARTFVREHPIASIAIAAAAGFVIGRIAARFR
jgi:ElaB/YqjD/DUF883 family membrane-anchored ribosome-binding protein